MTNTLTLVPAVPSADALILMIRDAYQDGKASLQNEWLADQVYARADMIERGL